MASKKNAQDPDMQFPPDEEVIETGGEPIAGEEHFTSPADVIGQTAHTEAVQNEFPPYWNPSPGDDMAAKKYLELVAAGKGRWFLAKPITLDNRDPNMVRWILQATHDVRCQRGPKDKREAVIVKAGDYFSMSDYAMLPFENLIGMEILVQVIGQIKTKQPQPAWRFSVKVTKDDKKLLDSQRAEAAKAAIEEYRARRAAKQMGAAQETKALPAAPPAS